MPRWGYMMNPKSDFDIQRARRIRDSQHQNHFSLLQGGQQRSTHFGQRGFVSPRSIMRMSSEYDSFGDRSDTSSPFLPGGYIAPGTHAVPTSIASASSFCRRATPRPTNYSSSGINQPSGSGGRFSSRLGSYGNNNHQFGYHHGHRQPLGPIFPEEDEDDFFPPETLPPIHEGFSDYCACDSDGVDYLDESSGFPQIGDNRSREKFEERLASFPEVPLDAHRRIFLMGNEIVDCFEVRLDRFYRGSLLDSVNDCVAVFTKKERTGQRWLMVFKEDIARTVVKFNRLLTHSLLVSVVSPTAIEVEAAKSLYGPPAEMCVINFVNTEDASRFYKTLQEGQTTAWNHREVTHEQRMKNIFTKINVALARADLMSSSFGIASGSAGSGGAGVGVRVLPEVHQSRSPFTFSHHKRSDPCDILTHTSKASNLSANQASGLTLRSRASSSSEMQHNPTHLADLDDDWRSRGRGGAGDGRELSEGAVSQQRERPRSQNRRLLKKSSSSDSGSLGSTSTSPLPLRVRQLRLDGSGDCNESMPGVDGGLKQSLTSTDRRIPADIMFQVFATVFLKLDAGDFAEFGTGTLQLLDHRDIALNELRLLDGEKREILQQYIYKWNSALKRSDDSSKTCVCIWDGAVCLSQEQDAVPERKNFKVWLSSEEEADEFVSSFRKSVEKASDESIRKRHICWYLQNKRDYKMTNPQPPQF